MPFPFRTVTVVFDGGGVFVLTFVPSAVAFATLATPTSGFTNSLTASWIDFVRGRQVAVAADLVAVEARLEEVPARKRRGEERVLEHGPAASSCRPTSTFFVIVETIFGRSNGLKSCATCCLNARTNSCWRASRWKSESVCRKRTNSSAAPPDQPLVARLEVDVGEVVVARAGVVVVVAPVDVHPDAAELVDDLLEPVEVDRDDVVDRDAGQLLDRLERALRAAASRRPS